MSNYDILSQKVVSNSQVLDIVSAKPEEDLTYREEKILEYVKKLEPTNLKNFQKIFDELLALEIPRLGEEHIIKIIDLKPKNGTELRAIVSNSGTVIVDENATKILDVLKSI